MLLWMDGFDHYGAGAGGAEIAEAGPWSNLVNAVPSTANPRTGGFALRMGGVVEARRALGGPRESVGFGGAYYLSNLPDGNNQCRLIRWANDGNVEQLKVTVESTGTLGVYRGNTRIHASSARAYARSYFHLEAFMVCDAAAGALEVRLNGVTVINLAGINTDPAGTGEISQIGVELAGGAVIDLDDVYAWDNTGAWNNDFIGDKKVYTSLPDADTATEEWDRASGGQSFAMVNSVPPADGAKYLFADEVLSGGGPKTVLDTSAIPLEVVAIAGAMLTTRAWKTDAGNAKVQQSIISGGTEDVGDEFALSQAPTYYADVFDVDPDTSAPWTVAGINATQVAIERTE